MADDAEFFQALHGVLYPLTAASSLLRVVDRADRDGVLRQLRDGADVADVANVTGSSEESARALCAALVANGIAVPDVSGFRLTPAWRALTAEGTFITLGDVLAQSRVIDTMMSGGEPTYSSLSPADRSAFAHAVSPNPYAAELVDRIRRDIAEDRWWAPMRSGGRYLELGCGIAGRMLTMLQAMPMLHAVGIELDPDLAEEARARAADLNLQDRVQIIAGDATTYRSEESFDFGFWSQWFFPSATRDMALASMLANVRSGGVVRAPVFGDHARIAAEPLGEEARLYTLNRVMLDSWGVPERTPDQLQAEFESAGFTDVTIVPGDIATTVYARRP
jgi:SAM-dependent methyltransferase